MPSFGLGLAHEGRIEPAAGTPTVQVADAAEVARTFSARAIASGQSAVSSPPGASAVGQTRRGLVVKAERSVRVRGLRGGTVYAYAASGSVVQFVGDAIVNAANNGCQGGEGGVDELVTAAGGPTMRLARSALPIVPGTPDRSPGTPSWRCRTGDAVVTVAGGQLSVAHCIHAVGPTYPSPSSVARRTVIDMVLRDAYLASMKRAQEQGVKSLAFSLLSVGILRGACSLEHVVGVGLLAIEEASYAGLEEVYFVGSSTEEVQVLTKLFDAMARGGAAMVRRLGKEADEAAAAAAAAAATAGDAAHGRGSFPPILNTRLVPEQRSSALRIGGIVCIATSWLIITMILLSISFDTLKPTEVGLRKYDDASRVYYDMVWANGRHCVGPNRRFVKYKTQVKFVEWLGLCGVGEECGSAKMGVWSKDMVSIELGVGMYFTIDPKRVVKLFKR